MLPTLPVRKLEATKEMKKIRYNEFLCYGALCRIYIFLLRFDHYLSLCGYLSLIMRILAMRLYGVETELNEIASLTRRLVVILSL